MEKRDCLRPRVKTEKAEDDIKDFAETTMNELLEWYGYGSKDDVKSRLYLCSNSNSSEPDSPRSLDSCGWCGKSVDENMGITSASATFCSELCFSQSRRANFKKNKTCDWCRHVRHTVSYVDFQDGASQLQFCSDKCLNQYKMHIFCRETRAHLEMHPHLVGENTDTALITPDLWLKNCKSPRSRSPSPLPLQKNTESREQTSPLPLITLTHPSKLIANHLQNKTNTNEFKRQRKLNKKTRKKTSTITSDLQKNLSDFPEDLSIKHSQNCSDLFTKKINGEQNPKITENSKINQTSSLNSNVLPPLTVLVPFPILLPVPIPIPIPLPISTFLKAYKKSEEDTSKTEKDEKIVEKLKENVENVDVDSPPEVVLEKGPEKTPRKRKKPEAKGPKAKKTVSV